MDNIYSKLLQVQAQLKAPKNQFNSFGKYKYRSCEDILEAVKPLLKEHKLTLTLNDTIEQVGGKNYVACSASVTFCGSIVMPDKVTVAKIEGDPQSIFGPITVKAYAREPEDKKGMDASQITGAASSYARKYALAGLFLLDDTKDADHTNNATDGEELAVKEIISEVTMCENLDELKAHYEANKELIKRHKLDRYYTLRKKELS